MLWIQPSRLLLDDSGVCGMESQNNGARRGSNASQGRGGNSGLDEFFVGSPEVAPAHTTHVIHFYDGRENIEVGSVLLCLLSQLGLHCCEWKLILIHCDGAKANFQEDMQIKSFFFVFVVNQIRLFQSLSF